MTFFAALVLAAATLSPAQQNALDSAVALVMRTQHIAGISLGIARGSSVLYENAYGLRDPLRGLPAQTQTIYRIGSLTKPFTAAAVVELAAQGRLKFDDDVSRFIAIPWHAPITVADLLLQRSGIPSYTDTALDSHGAYSPADLINAVAAKPLQFDPGTAFAYSNTNYVLLGMAIERIAGAPYAKALEAHVIAPLGLTDSRYGDPPGEAPGFAWNGAGWSPASRNSLSYAYAAAGLSSNIGDLLRFLPTLRAPYDGMLAGSVYGHPVRVAWGNVDGYSAFALRAPQSGVTIVLLSNEDRVDLLPLAKSIFAVLVPPLPGTAAPGGPEGEGAASGIANHRAT